MKVVKDWEQDYTTTYAQSNKYQKLVCSHSTVQGCRHELKSGGGGGGGGGGGLHFEGVANIHSSNYRDFSMLLSC